MDVGKRETKKEIFWEELKNLNDFVFFSPSRFEKSKVKGGFFHLVCFLLGKLVPVSDLTGFRTLSGADSEWQADAAQLFFHHRSRQVWFSSCSEPARATRNPLTRTCTCLLGSHHFDPCIIHFGHQIFPFKNRYSFKPGTHQAFFAELTLSICAVTCVNHHKRPVLVD